MKIKRILAVCLLLCMMLSLAACGDEGTPYVPPVSNEGGSNAGNNSGENNGGENNTGNNGNNGGDVILADWREFNTEGVSDEVVLEADNDCVITVSGIDYDDGYVELDVELENPTDKLMYLELKGMYINDIEVDAWFYTSAEADDDAEETIEISMDALRLQGIFEVANVEILFLLYDSDWEDEETVSCAFGTSIEDEYKVNKDAFVNAITSEDAQEEIGYEVVDANRTEIELIDDVYITSRVFVQAEGESVVFVEVVNRSKDAYYIEQEVNNVNGLTGYWGNDSIALLPGTTGYLWVGLYNISAELMQAFGMEEISTMDWSFDIYEGGNDLDFDYYDFEEAAVSYVVPDTEPTLDLSATVLYEKDGLKISYKEPITNDYDETYIYLICEAEGADFYVCEDWEEEIVVDGECSYSYIYDPGLVEEGTEVIGYLELDELDADSVTMYLEITDYSSDEYEDYTIELVIEF